MQLLSLNPPILDLIRMAVHEDLGAGDKTVQLAIPADLRTTARIVGRRDGIISGTPLLAPVLREYPAGNDVTLSIQTPDAHPVRHGQTVATLTGPVRTILSAERVLLNFLCHLSGVATATRRYVDAIADIKSVNGQPPAICDTRKTTPGFRALDKYAVRCGGGVNHRIGLYDGVMLKDNHLAALREKLGVSNLSALTRQIRTQLPHEMLLWLEVDTLDQLSQEFAGEGGGADIVLIDNFTPDQMKQAVQMRNAAAHDRGARRPLLEASGGITDQNLRTIAQTGVDRISIGAITHSAPALNLSMEFD
jgi:nicotinate-nucleotide pyrophosphorylase (carboxylating)